MRSAVSRVSPRMGPRCVLVLGLLAGCDRGTQAAQPVVQVAPSEAEHPVDPSEHPRLEVIYLATEDSYLLAFDPQGRSFMTVGRMECGSAPRSMSVDRQDRAWLSAHDGNMYWVSTEDASCQPSTWRKGAMGFWHFGMGFVHDPDGGDALYLASAEQLGRVDTRDASLSVVGELPRHAENAELAGGDASGLYAWWPHDAELARVDRTGKQLATWKTPPLDGEVRAWAAASLNGKLYLFVTTMIDGAWRSRVFAFDLTSSTTEEIVSSAPRVVVGAGVGTRAPVVQ